ncbi:response regulator of citrate/malate metabolism [Tamaricihabitans halophyticus]|uniref:Transcriptional regulatory protein n=1 Tax=Tamaricihabitans halophyticus TaxID=1262583 RepID=A0A4R2R4M4_9PSEU|nr:response regulator [Tamaricihabitans halophyticus]TCP54325.1 response regulator of citrate/malate metabolism [Tamaricihabitans halophyticus]
MISVLVVDDDFMVAKVHGGYVTRTPGFTVAGVAHTGADALRAVRELAPDLVLLDIYLPDMDGISVLRELRADDSGPDVIVITAARDVDTIRAAMHGGVLHYLIKPFGYPALHDQLRHFATLRAKLDGHPGSTALGQADVDQVFGTRPRGSTTLPKGLTAQTAELVERALRETGTPISASACAERVQLSRVSVRRYLEFFVDHGKAEVTLRYGGAGRPERLYCWSAH